MHSPTPTTLEHLTVFSGRNRARSPRSEVDDNSIRLIRRALADGGGALDNTGWGLLVIRSEPTGHVYDLSCEGIEVARCWLAVSPEVEAAIWDAAKASPTLPGVVPRKPETLPWLAAALLPDGLVLLSRQPERFGELGDLERVVAWALLEAAA